MSLFTTILFLHVLGATVWTGGHLVLALTVLPRALRARDPEILLAFESRYERLGMPALVVQVVTGLWLAYHWLPDPSAWVALDSTLSVAITAKLALLLVTLALALSARWRVLPRLDAETLPLLALHVVGVTIASVLFVFAGVVIRAGGL